MYGLTCVPSTVTEFLTRFKRHFTCPQGRHFLITCWIVTALILDTGTGHLKGLMRYIPTRISYWAALRMMRAAQWSHDSLIHDAAQAVLAALPQPADRTLYLIGDPTLKGKRGTDHPLGRKTRMNQFSPYIFAFETVLVIAHFGPYRVPVFAGVVDPKIRGHTNQLFRKAIEQFEPPSWVKQVVVLGDAGLPANATIKAIRTYSGEVGQRFRG